MQVDKQTRHLRKWDTVKESRYGEKDQELAFRHVIFEIPKKNIKLRCQANVGYLDLELKTKGTGWK